MDPREPTDSDLQKLEEKAQKAQEAFEKEEKLRKEVEALNAKLLQEKADLLASLEGEKGSLSDIQEKANKLQAQKTDLESQLHVSIILTLTVMPLRYINMNIVPKRHPLLATKC
jgi:predicted nuclease with TOPRIM domain